MNLYLKMVDNLKKRPETPITGRGACLLMYNCGLKSLYEPQLFKLCERDIAISRNKLDARLVFGGLYGALKTNAASPYLLEFFIEEFKFIMNKKNEETINSEGEPTTPSKPFPKYSQYFLFFFLFDLFLF